MPGYIANGQEVTVPGLTILNWRDQPGLRLRVGQIGGGNDGRRRHTRWIRQVILHTTKGIPGGKDQRAQQIRPGRGPDAGTELAVAKFWATSSKASGAHFVIDFDGSVGCLADVATEAAYHAGVVNDHSIGIEIYQGADAEIYQAQLVACRRLCDALTAQFGIQRQIHKPYTGPVRRLERGGKDCVGVFGHRDVTDSRGPGDPGDAIFHELLGAGYEAFDFGRATDRKEWIGRQRALNETLGTDLDLDGIPGPATARALAAAGHPDGLYTCPVADEPPMPADVAPMLQQLVERLGLEQLRRLLKRWLP